MAIFPSLECAKAYNALYPGHPLGALTQLFRDVQLGDGPSTCPRDLAEVAFNIVKFNPVKLNP